MQLARYFALAVLGICALTWFYGRVLYPIPIRFEGPSDDTPEVDPRPEQRFRQFEGG
jgi:hypothetical protein